MTTEQKREYKKLKSKICRIVNRRATGHGDSVNDNLRLRDLSLEIAKLLSSDVN